MVIGGDVELVKTRNIAIAVLYSSRLRIINGDSKRSDSTCRRRR